MPNSLTIQHATAPRIPLPLDSEPVDDTTRTRALSAQRDVLDAGGSPEDAALAYLQVLAGSDLSTAAVAGVTEDTMELLDVSPDGFMALLRAQVSREDEKILWSRNQIEQAISESRALSHQMQALQEIHQVLTQEGDEDLKMEKGSVSVNGETMSIGEAIVRFDLIDALNLRDAYSADDDEWFVGKKLRASSVQSAIEGLRQAQQSVTSENEMKMITMQQAMQQRGLHVQLVSKVLAMFSDTDRAIVGNMR